MYDDIQAGLQALAISVAVASGATITYISGVALTRKIKELRARRIWISAILRELKGASKEELPAILEKYDLLLRDNSFPKGWARELILTLDGFR